MAEFGFSDEILQKIADLEALENKRTSPNANDVLQQELASLNLYKVAANAGEDRDPSGLGEIEQLLRSGNTEGLKARLGATGAAKLQDEYVKAWRQVESDKNSIRSTGEAITDAVVGVPSSIINTIWGAEMIAGGLASPDYMAVSSEANREFNQETVDPLLSDALKARRRHKQALDAGDEESNKYQAKQEIIAGGNSTLAQGKRFALDFGDGVANTLSDSTLLLQGTIEAAGSMGSAAALKTVLSATGKTMLKKQAAAIGIREAAGETTEGVLGKLGAATVKGLNKHMDALAWAGSNAALEGSGAYQETVAEVLLKPIKELEANSEDFRAKVAELEAQDVDPTEARIQAQRWLARKAGMIAAGTTGVAAAGLSSLLGGAGKAPTRVVSGSLIKDMLGEGLEEGLQGASGGLIGNATIKGYVDPNQDMLAGVGMQAGEGAVLGMASAGAMKSPSALIGVGQATNEARSKLVKQPQPKGQALSGNLGQQADSLFQDRDTRNKLRTAVNVKLAENPETLGAARRSVKELMSAPVVSALPDSHARLSPENQTEFNVGQNRVRAIETASKLLLSEKDPEAKMNLAIFLSNLMDPIGKFQETPAELESVMADPELGKSLEGYQKLLSSISQLPLVQEAQTEMLKVFEALDADLDTMEPEQAAQVLVAQAMVDPHLSENVTSGQLRKVLLKAEGRALTPAQRLAIKGSEAIVKAREAKLKERGVANPRMIAKHLGKSSDEVSAEAVTSTDPSAVETGKYSARQHMTRIIKAMQAGKVDLAKSLIQEYAEFVQHYQNKAEALEKSRKNGGTKVPYLQRITSKDGSTSWMSSETNPNQRHKFAYFNAKSEKSITHAQEVDAEASLLSDLLKNLITAYPELALEKMPEPRRIAESVRNSDPKKLANPAPAVKKQEKPKPAAETVTAALTRATAPVAAVEPVQIPGTTPASQNTVKPNTIKGPTNKLDKLVSEKKAVVKDGAYYVQDPAATNYIAGTTPSNQVYVNVGKLRASKDALMKYLTSGPTSAQKQAMLALMGLDLQAFHDAINTSVRDLARFLRDHELSHQKNQDTKSYPKKVDGSPDLAHPKAIQIEARATLDALSDEQLAKMGTNRKAVQDRINGKKPSKTPEFDKLPTHKAGQQTMTYAGIGARSAPPAIQKVLTEVARRLEGLGYTLQTGDAKGADAAFAAGASNKKVFTAKHATNQTRAIAREIHPNPQALSAFPLDLMARNTNQLFGANLDSPVDFVLVWTEDGAESTADRSMKTGGSGQAIDMAARKGIPVINVAKAGWQQRLNEVVSKKKKPIIAEVKERLAEYWKALGEPGQVRAYLTDALTGLYNKTSAEHLGQDPKRQFLAIFSLEGKKFLNDAHGHDSLDGAFRVMAQVLAQEIPDGMKVGGDIQGFHADLKTAQKIAAKMQKALGPDFKVLVDGAVRDPKSNFDSNLKAAYKAHTAMMDKARDAGEAGHRKAPPKALQDASMPQGINWDWDEKAGNTTGVNPESPQVKKWLASVAAKTADFGARLTKTALDPREELIQELEPKAVAAAGKLTSDQMRDATYVEANTGLLTLDGFHVASKLMEAFSSMDLRSLKLMNNLFLEAGANGIMEVFGRVLVKLGGDRLAAAHLHGDEYAMAGMNREQLEKLAQAFEEELHETTFYQVVLNPDGSFHSLVVQEGVSFAKGFGSTLEEADRVDLARRKEADKKAGKQPREPVRLVGDAAQQRLTELKVSESDATHDLGTRQATTEELRGEVRATSESSTGQAGVRSEQAVVPKKLSEIFTSLFKTEKIRNLFTQGYQLASAPKGSLPTRVMGKENSVQIAHDAINSEVVLEKHLGKAPRSKLTPEVIKAFQGLLVGVSDETMKQMAAWKAAFKKANQHLTGKPRRSEYKFPKVAHGTQTVGDVMAMVETNLNEFLDSWYVTPITAAEAKEKKKSPREGMTFREAIEKGLYEPTVKQRGKVINVTEIGPDGKLRYNPALLQQAALAAFQWQISGSQRQVTKREDDVAADLAQELGIGVEGQTISDEVIRRLSQGENLQQAKKSLADTIQRFWGVKSDPTQVMGFNEAIHEAMAGEMLRAMTDLGLVQVDEVNLMDLQPSLGIHQIVNRYVPTNWTPKESEEQSPIYSYPELLEEIVLVEPEFRTFYGKEIPKVRGTQLANEHVEVTTQQHLAVTNMQEQPFTLNIPMMKALIKLMPEQIIELFGHVLPSTEAERNTKYNKNDLASLEGKNRSVLGAFEELKRVVAEMEGVAKAQQVPLEGLQKRYQYAVTRMNRVMMLGAHNPQASKLMREVLLPTWANLDLTNEEHEQHRKLTVAQALGRKINRFTLAENVKWVDDILAQELLPAREVIQAWQKDREQPFPATSFKAAVGDVVELNPLMMMALIENERAVSSKDKKNFRTPLYLEADGMTNGPFNSIGLLSTGPFSEEQLRSMKRGGLAVSSTAKTANELRPEVENKDLYTAGTDATTTEVRKLRAKIWNQGGTAHKQLKELAKAPQNGDTKEATRIAKRDMQSASDVLNVQHQLLTAMSHLFNGDLKWTEKNGKWELELERGIGKNPITILVYGSSTNGIAGNFAYNMETAFYQKISELAQTGTPLSPELLDAIDTITGQTVVHHKDKFFIGNDSAKFAATDRLQVTEKHPDALHNFTFTPEERARIQNNLHTLFVKPMEEGVKSVIGPSVFATRDLLVQATSLQSTMAREMLLKSIAQKMADKEDARAKSYEAAGMDPKAAATKARNEVASEFLSREELSAAWDELREVMPVVESDGQHFLIAKNALLAFFSEDGSREPKWQYSRSLDNNYRTSPYATGIAPSGVSAVPYLTIGMGDARMVRKIFETAFANTMQVYDGVNIPVDQITKYGKRINKAALEAWQGDVLSSVSLTFERFLRVPEVQAALRDPAVITKLAGEKIDVGAVGDIAARLKQGARSQRARKTALSKVPLSMDQMAGAYSPHTAKGEIQIPEDASVTDIKAILDVEYAKAYAEEEARDSGAKLEVEKRIQPQIRRAPGSKPSGKVTVAEMLRTLELSPEQRQVLTNLVRSGALENVKIVTGDLQHLIQHQIANFGASSIAENLGERTVGGLYSPSENTVYLLNPTPEVVVHELIHAATYQAVEAHYGNLKMGRQGTRVKAAVQRLEQLMNLFLAQETTETEGALVDTTIAHVKAVIREHLSVGDAVGKAAALNEFMSYSLSNQDLIEEFSKRSLGKQFMKLLKATVQAMVRLVWRTEHATPKQMDFLKAVRFNTYALAHAQARFSLTEELQGILVAHETISGTEGTRLQDLLETFSRKIAGNLDQNYSANELERIQGENKTEEYSKQVEDLTYAADYLFTMNSEEQQVFHMMVSAFATEGQINPHVMIEGQKIFDHFLKNMKQSDFLTGDRDEAYDRDQAKDKFEFLSGHTMRIDDSKGRSSVLPVFMALAMTSENFRQVLVEKNMPEVKGQPITGLDTALEVAGTKLLSSLEHTLSGTNQPENVKAALQQLHTKLVKDTLTTRGVIEDKLEAMNKGTNGINARMVHLMQRVGSASYRKGHALQNSSSEFDRKLGAALKAVSFISSERDAKIIEEGILKFFDQHPNTWQWVRSLVSDLIGRVASQGAVYDLLKKARTMASQSRQAFRDNTPAIILELFKQNKPSLAQLDSFYTVMGKYDMASLIAGSKTAEDVLALVSDREALKQEVAQLEHSLQTNYPFQSTQYQVKIDQLVKFIQTGVRGPALLRNAHAIAALVGQPKGENWVAPDASTVQMIDQLVTLKLLAQSSEQDLNTLAEFVRDEPTAMQFMLSYLKGQRATELAKATEGLAKFNHYKGELPSDNQVAGHIVVKPDEEHESMIAKGYKWIGAYSGSSLERGTGTSKPASQSYYFSPDGSARAAFSQGIAQNIQQTAYGVHANTGRSLGATAGGITDKALVAQLAKNMNSEAAGPENLSPVFGLDGQVIAFERSLDPEQLKKIQRPQNLPAMLGRWRGRQAEEIWGSKINEDLVDALAEMYNNDLTADRDRYVNLFTSSDPIIRDAVSILPFELKELAEKKFGEGKFMVRRNLVDQVIGYRNASVTDIWTGNTRWSKNTQEIVQKSLMHFLGTDAYRILANGERNWQAMMASVRTNIVVRSLIVPAANFVAGTFQLAARGVSPLAIAKGVPAKVAEIEFFTKTMREKIQLEAERWASEHDVQKTRAIDARLQVMEDSLRHLSIWPLIEAGEFSTIADVGQTAEELGIGPNNIMDKLSQAVDQLPGGLREAAKVGYLARDTSLFQALQKSVQYSDFVMKAIYFDHLTKDQKMPSTAAKALVTEEFVNYDLLPGRNRAYLENMGLMWFMNFKIRSTKIALSMIRNNPFNLLMFSIMPHPFGADIPVTGNFLSKLFEGLLGFSIGPRMAFQSIALSPWYNLIAD